MDRYTASSSRSKVLYLVSARVILCEKNEMGCHVPCIAVAAQLSLPYQMHLSSGRWGRLVWGRRGGLEPPLWH